MEIEKKKNFIINVLYFLSLGLAITGIVKIGIPLFLPFIISFAVVYMLQGVIEAVYKKTKVKRSIVSMLVLGLFYATVGVSIVILALKIGMAAKEFLIALPNIYSNDIAPAITAILQIFDSFNFADDMFSTGFVQKLTEQLAGLISQVSVKAIEGASSFAAALPGAFIVSLITIISSFFVAADYPDLIKFVADKLPKKTSLFLTDIKEYISGTLLKYIKSYGIIMVITFLEMSMGLFILGVPNVFVISAIIAVFDIAPVLGSGGILIPWAVIEAVKGNFIVAGGLLALYLMVTIIRNIIEPKIIGQQIGLHPLITLISMFVGLKLFGVVGLLMLPVSVVILKNLHDKGKLKLYRSL